ncbi:unnamed protein product, partial [Onchocerca ochengi]|uniref:Kazal-like domain-containing protein n=1 Tax=Onchocerca ochengi TaxID=42157 RepID=A0A182EZE2_ONCOC
MFGLDTVTSLHKSKTSFSFESISCVIGLTTIAFDCCPFGSPVCKPYLMQHNAVLCGPLQWKHDRFLKLQSSVACPGFKQLRQALILARYSIRCLKV